MMERHEAVMQCVAEMRKLPRFASASDDQKAKAAAYAFDRLHEDAEQHLAMGCSEDDLRHYAKAATKRVHERTSSLDPGQFEVSNGFPLMLVISLLPSLWSWFKMLKEWMGW